MYHSQFDVILLLTGLRCSEKSLTILYPVFKTTLTLNVSILNYPRTLRKKFITKNTFDMNLNLLTFEYLFQRSSDYYLTFILFYCPF